MRAPVLLLAFTAPLLASCFLLRIDETKIAASDGGAHTDAEVDGDGGTVTDGGAITDGDSPDAWTPCRERTTKPPSLCDDFDDPSESLGGKWSEPNFVAGGATLTMTSVARSGPNAASARVPALDGRTLAAARLVHKPSLTTATAITLGFSFHVTAAPFPIATTGALYSIASMAFEPVCASSSTSPRELLLLFTGDGQLVLDIKAFGSRCSSAEDFSRTKVGRSVSDFVDAPGEPVRWRRIVMRAETSPCPGDASGHAASVTIDGVPLLCRSVPLDPMTVLTAFVVSVGMFSNGPASASELEIDDVTLDVE